MGTETSELTPVIEQIHLTYMKLYLKQ